MENLRIEVRFRTILRHQNNKITNQQDYEVPPNSMVKDVLRLLDLPDKLDIIIALNGQVVDENMILANGDCLELIPAIVGG
jgi:sulfur carrier protein ThiS